MIDISDAEIIDHFRSYAYRAGVRQNTMRFLHFQTADLVAAVRLLHKTDADTSSAISAALKEQKK